MSALYRTARRSWNRASSLGRSVRTKSGSARERKMSSYESRVRVTLWVVHQGSAARRREPEACERRSRRRCWSVERLERYGRRMGHASLEVVSSWKLNERERRGEPRAGVGGQTAARTLCQARRVTFEISREEAG